MYRVVLVDDERLILRGLSTVVPWAELGCEVAGTAHDGADGLEQIRKLRPDIVLTDIRMPNMDGLTMLAAIRSEFPEIQMSVLTAYRDFDYARQAITLGVCRYLLKPSDLEELKDAVRQMVSRLDAMPRLREETVDDESVREAGNHLVKAALAYMKEHCTEQHLSLGDVADHVYVSQWHLSKLLNREMGVGFLELLNGMRIDAARELLLDPGRRIVDVAYETGFSDVAHFSKTFKKITGRTPGEYRSTQPHPKTD